jgi:hypothetical protein
MTTIRPLVQVYRTPVRGASPLATSMAGRLARLLGRGINGHAGTVRYGQPAPGTRQKFGGYASPPQLFTGYDPRRVAAGAFRGAPGSLPATSPPGAPGASPLQRAMATVTSRQLGGT